MYSTDLPPRGVDDLPITGVEAHVVDVVVEEHQIAQLEIRLSQHVGRLYCCPDECGRLTSTDPQAFIVSPEQSQRLGPAPAVAHVGLRAELLRTPALCRVRCRLLHVRLPATSAARWRRAVALFSASEICCRCSAVSLASTFFAWASFLSEASVRDLSCFSFSARAARSAFAASSRGREFRLGLLEVLKRRVLILADLLHRGDLAEEALGVGSHEELGGGVKARFWNWASATWPT